MNTMKYKIEKQATYQATYQVNTQQEVADVVGCSLSNIKHHFSTKKKKWVVINKFLITKLN